MWPYFTAQPAAPGRLHALCMLCMSHLTCCWSRGCGILYANFLTILALERGSPYALYASLATALPGTPGFLIATLMPHLHDMVAAVHPAWMLDSSNAVQPGLVCALYGFWNDCRSLVYIKTPTWICVLQLIDSLLSSCSCISCTVIQAAPDELQQLPCMT